MFKGLLRTLRPHQWIKNLFVLAPLFFSMSFMEGQLLLLGLTAALLFSLTAGTVYLFNDLFDIQKDREHPTKRHRPIPSGELPVPVAISAALVLGGGAVTTAFFVDWRFGAVVAGYLVMNLAYSTFLKHVPLSM